MNRNQKRKFIKAAGEKGIDKSMAELYLKMKQHGSPPIELKEGDMVRLNINSIQKHPDYSKLSVMYREFVEVHKEDIFTVVYDRRRQLNPTEVCLKEDPFGWMFWTGDLIKVSD